MVRLRRIVVWFPAVSLALQLTLGLHSRLLIGRWPVQYQDPEGWELADRFWTAHSVVAWFGILGFLVALAAWPTLLFLTRRGTRDRVRSELTVFVVPIAAWWVLSVVWPEFGRFVG